MHQIAATWATCRTIIEKRGRWCRGIDDNHPSARSASTSLTTGVAPRAASRSDRPATTSGTYRR